MNDILYEQKLDSVDGFEITFYALVEHDSPYAHYDDDVENIKQLCIDIDDGKYVWFCAKITASKLGIELAYDYLGACCFKSYEDFIKDEYFKDMVDTVVKEAKEFLAKLCQC